MTVRSNVAAASAVVCGSVALVSAAPVTVELSTGETLKGEFVSRGEKEAVFKSDAAGVVSIPAGNIKNIVAADGVASGYVATGEPGLFGTDFLAGWSKELELGVTGTNGNSDSITGNAALRFSTDNDEYRATAGAWYFLTNNNSGRSRNEARVYATFDKYLNDIDPKLFIFVRGQYDFDEFQAWENRASLYVGPGYDFVKKDNYEMTGRFGLGATQEFGGADDDFRIEAFLGVDGKWAIDSNQTLGYSFYYYPSLENLDDGRVVSHVHYTADVDKAKGLAVRLGIENIYDFRTKNSDADHSNWKYYANLLLKF
jgi:hypothetical protein